MKRLRSHAALLAATTILSCVALWGCASTTYTGSSDRPVEVTFGPATTRALVDLDGRRYKVALDQIIDSRCPANAKCIWAGELAARLEIKRVDTASSMRDFTLGEETVTSIEILGASIELVSIDESSVTFSIRAADQS